MMHSLILYYHICMKHIKVTMNCGLFSISEVKYIAKRVRDGLGGVAFLVECLLRVHEECWAPSPVASKLGVVTHDCNSSIHSRGRQKVILCYILNLRLDWSC